jgi:cytochrome c2
MAPVMQMEVGYRLEARGMDEEVEGAVYLTVNRAAPVDLAAEGFDENAGEALANRGAAGTPQPEAVASAERGAALYRQFGCDGCHSSDGSTEGKTGPTLKGLFGSARHLDDGTTVTADEAYIRTALLEPEAQVVAGYSVAMASYQGILDETDLASLVLFIQSLQ